MHELIDDPLMDESYDDRMSFAERNSLNLLGSIKKETCSSISFSIDDIKRLSTIQFDDPNINKIIKNRLEKYDYFYNYINSSNLPPNMKLLCANINYYLNKYKFLKITYADPCIMPCFGCDHLCKYTPYSSNSKYHKKGFPNKKKFVYTPKYTITIGNHLFMGKEFNCCELCAEQFLPILGNTITEFNYVIENNYTYNLLIKHLPIDYIYKPLNISFKFLCKISNKEHIMENINNYTIHCSACKAIHYSINTDFEYIETIFTEIPETQNENT